MAKTKSELESFLYDFTQQHCDQTDIFKKIESAYFQNKQQNFVALREKHRPSNIHPTVFAQGYQAWRRLKELEEEEKISEIKKTESKKQKGFCLASFKKMISDLGGGNFQQGMEYYNLYLNG